MRNRHWVRIIGAVATIWNAIGVVNYLIHVGVIGSGGPPAGVMPPIVTACFALGVFAGVAGGVALVMRSLWARLLLWLSWIATVINWTWVLGWSEAASIPLGAAVLLLATMFAIVAERDARHEPAPD